MIFALTVTHGGSETHMWSSPCGHRQMCSLCPTVCPLGAMEHMDTRNTNLCPCGDNVDTGVCAKRLLVLA